MTSHGLPDGPRSARYILKDYVQVRLVISCRLHVNRCCCAGCIFRVGEGGGGGGWIVGKALWSDYKRMQSSELSFSLCNRYELLLHLLYSMK